MIQYQIYIYELNGILIELVKFLAVDYRVKYRLLDLMATPYKCKITEEMLIKTSTSTNTNVLN